MKRTTISNHLDAFINEASMLLRFQFAMNRIAKLDNNNITRSDYVDRLIALKAIENDMLIRICKFNDKESKDGVHSFNVIINEIASLHPNKQILEEKITHFKSLIKPLIERRHTQLAHLKIGIKDNEYGIRFNFLVVIKLIIEIIDLLNQDIICYKWSDGSQEKFDLREEIFSQSNNNCK